MLVGWGASIKYELTNFNKELCFNVLIFFLFILFLFILFLFMYIYIHT